MDSMFANGFDATAMLDSIVAILFVCLLIWGGQNKFGTGEFHDDSTSLEVVKSLRGFAAIGVMLHHVSQEPMFQERHVLSLFVNAGVYFVAIFLFCSGYGLIKSLNTKKDYFKGFIKKRVVRSLVVPFYIDVIFYGIFLFLTKTPDAVGRPLTADHWVCNFLGLTMMNQYAWFPIVLAILYIVFYLCFRFIKKRPVCYVILLLVMLALGVGFCFNGHYAWWYGPNNWWMEESTAMAAKWWQWDATRWFSGEWWVNTMPAFLSGILFASYEEKIVNFFKKSYALKFAILIAVTLGLYVLSDLGQSKFGGYWTEYQMNGPEIADKLVAYFCQIPLLFVFPFTIFIFMMKYYTINPVTRFYGKYSLHTYLMNLMAISLLRFMQFRDYSPIKLGTFDLPVMAICVVALSTLLGVREQKIVAYFQRLLFEKREVPVYRSLLSDGEGEEDSADDRKARAVKNFKKAD